MDSADSVHSGSSTKVHALVDALGNPVKLLLSAGQAHEMTKASELLEEVRDAYVIGDSAYSSRALVEQLVRQRCVPLLATNPTHKSRKDEPFDRHLYRDRCLVEHFFQRIKRFRRLAMRFEKLAKNFLAFLHLASALVWLA